MIQAGLFSQVRKVRLPGTKIGIDHVAMAQVKCEGTVDLLKS
jgi:hypothetical protein